METAAKTTCIQERRDTLLSIASQICFALHIKEDKYYTWIFEMGCRYLEILIPDDMEARQQISNSPIYWGWWKNHWAVRDEAWLIEIDIIDTDEECFELYKRLHNPRRLVSSVGYYGQRLNDSYATMIGALNKSFSRSFDRKT